MDQVKPSEETHDFYYVVFGSPISPVSSVVLYQDKPKPGQADHGFNFPHAHQMLMGMLNVPLVITGWQKISYIRCVQWLKFVGDTKGEKPVIRHLTLVKEPETP